MLPPEMRVLAFLLALSLVVGCGGDEGPSSGSPTKPKGSASGTGYSLDPPEGWKDITAEFEDSAIRVDRAYGGPVEGKVRLNVNILREDPGGDPSLDDVEQAFRQQVQQLAGGDLSPTERIELDGDDAVTWQYATADSSGLQGGRQRQVATVHDGRVFTITFTGPDEGFAEHERLLDEMLASWRWED